MSHHGLRWDHDTQPIRYDPPPAYLLQAARPPRWWLTPLIVVTTTALILGAAVGYAWTVLHDPRPIGIASLGLAAGVHTAVAIEYLVLRRATRGRR